MYRSRLLSVLFPLAFVSLLAWVPSGCSNESSGFGSPGDGLPASGDDVAPLMPAGFNVVKATDDGLRMTWTPNTELDLAGYRVYVYDPSPNRDNAYVCPHGVSLIAASQNWYVYASGTGQQTFYFKISAVDQAGNESPRFGPYVCSWTPDTWDGTFDDRQTDENAALPGSGWDDSGLPGRDDSVIDDHQ